MKPVNPSFILVLLLIQASAQAQPTETKLTVSEFSGDNFGISVATDGNYLIGGAPTAEEGRGAAFVFKRDGENWIQQAKLIASDGRADDNFGMAVAISGDYVLVGAGNTTSGSVYLFKRDAETWSEQIKLSADDGAESDRFGISVALLGDYAVVGDPSHDAGKGTVYVFKRNGESWDQLTKLFPADAPQDGNYFGRAVAISSARAIIGATLDEENGALAGAAYIFKRDGDHWLQQAKIKAADGKSNDIFGESVAIDGDYALVGATGNASGQGAAYVFTHVGDNWTQQAKLTTSDGYEGDRFASAVTIADDIAVVGAHDIDIFGHAYLFHREGTGTQWRQAMKLTPGDSAVFAVFGVSVAMSGGRLVVGANGVSSGAGAVYVYSGIETVVSVEQDASYTLPDDFALEQNYPNPFNPQTTIPYRLPRQADVRLTIFDALGRTVRRLVEHEQPGGFYSVTWDGRDDRGRHQASGLYLYKLQAGAFKKTAKMLLLR